MTHLFRNSDTLTAARLGLAAPAVPTCACCGFDQDADDMADQVFAGPELTEAQTHYRGPICAHCYENMSTCAHCGNHRRARDMFSLTGPVCSPRCDADLEYLNYARDERLTGLDYGL